MCSGLKSPNSQCTVQIIHKLHLAPGNKQRHEALSCLRAQSTSLPLAMEKLFVSFGCDLPVFKDQGQVVQLFGMNVLC